MTAKPPCDRSLDINERQSIGLRLDGVNGRTEWTVSRDIEEDGHIVRSVPIVRYRNYDDARIAAQGLATWHDLRVYRYDGNGTAELIYE